MSLSAGWSSAWQYPIFKPDPHLIPKATSCMNERPELRHVVAQWVSKGEEDLTAAEYLLTLGNLMLAAGESYMWVSRGGRISPMASKSGLANYKIILYAQEGGGWVAEIPAIGGCYALMDTREKALKELEKVFRMIQEEYAESGKPLPADRTELLVHA